MKNIVIQGDSITDANRQQTIHGQGCGYAAFVNGYLCSKFPGEYKVINTGVSGDKIINIYSRIKCDIWNHNPDYLSIFVGINDIWHGYNPSNNGVDPVRFEKVYDLVIEETLERFPNVKIMLIAPFISKGAVLDDLGEKFEKEVYDRAKIVQKIADKHNLTCITLQDKFDKAYNSYPEVNYWTVDGVHPTPAGHQLIADAWLDAFKKIN